MTAEEFYNKCVPDAKYFFNVYFAFMYGINQLPADIDTVNSKSGRNINSSEQKLFYLLYLIYKTKTDIGEMFRQNGVNVEDFYNVPEPIENILLNSVLDNVDGYGEAEINKYYIDYFTRQDTLKFDFHNMGKITIEQTLDKLIPYFLAFDELMDTFKLAELLDQIQGLGIAKASEGTMRININRGLGKEELKKAVMGPSSDNDPTSKSVSMGEELTKKEYTENPLIGREKELRLMGAYLLDDKKSLILHGKPGVGKTTLVEGLAYLIQKGTAHQLLSDKRIFEVSAAEMVSGTKYRGQFEQKMLNLIRELMDIPSSILFIDEIHMIMGGGRTLGDTIDISNMLKPYVGNGKIKVVGATTTEEFEMIKSNSAMARRFNSLPISELSSYQVINILNNQIANYQNKRNIAFGFDEQIKNDILNLILALTDKKYHGDMVLYNPDFALTLLGMAFNFALYDEKSIVSVEDLVESIEVTETINQDGKDYFKEEIYKRVRHL